MNEQLIRWHEAEANRLHAEFHATVAGRDNGVEGWRVYKKALEEWSEFTTEVDDLWEPANWRRIERGEGYWRHYAILFLEQDPWYFRSGYLREKLLPALRRACLREDERERLRRVMLQIVDSRHRREFRYFSRLAAAVADSALEEQLEARTTAADLGIRLRAGWMLAFLRRHPSH